MKTDDYYFTSSSGHVGFDARKVVAWESKYNDRGEFVWVIYIATNAFERNLEFVLSEDDFAAFRKRFVELESEDKP